MTSLRQKVFLEQSQKDFFLRRWSRKDIDIDATGKCIASAENKYIFMSEILLITRMGKFKAIRDMILGDRESQTVINLNVDFWNIYLFHGVDKIIPFFFAFKANLLSNQCAFRKIYVTSSNHVNAE